MLVRKAYLEVPLQHVHLKNNASGEAVSSLQNRLKELGYYLDTVTGTYSSSTEQAIRKFQLDTGLPVTGETDWKTYLHLWRDAGKEIIPVKRAVTLAATGASIYIYRGARTLALYQNGKPYRSYPIGVGKPGTPTPLGNFSIATKLMNPGGLLGSRWMGLNFDSNYGIHGTNRPWSIGQAVSLGCIRMHNGNVEEVYNMVRLGTPVFIRE